ncbi:MAG: CBS domain-containing protein [Gammaproteobacteria bacterium]|nr:CBS domain-containing protein [Gammaproteobacteria bacterium]MDH5512111.1 CBS domain-containing protein [Gammaproteobacteria bacterium]
MGTISEKVERHVVLLDENKTTQEAAALMSEKHIGSVVVTRNSEVVGLFTERDLIRQVICERRNPEKVTIKEVMRTKVPMVDQDESGEKCIELMKQHKCRHVLVFDEDAFVGIISMRDLLVLVLEEKEELIRQLTKYVTT